MNTPDISSTASRLCAACGMCCNGVLFHIVRLQAGESPKAMAALGLKVKRKRGESHVTQPCAAHCDSQCVIYASRPQRCRAFACRQLQRVASGEISEAMARDKISEAVQLVAQVDALLLLAGGGNLKKPLTQRCETALAEPHEPSLLETKSEIRRLKAKLDALLEQDFRTEPIGASSAASS
jgi:hypothetical protein